jgi:hypothetical protein
MLLNMDSISIEFIFKTRIPLLVSSPECREKMKSYSILVRIKVDCVLCIRKPRDGGAAQWL